MSRAEHESLFQLEQSIKHLHTHTILDTVARALQGRRADKKLARGEVPPLLLKIDGVVGLETAFAFLKMAPGS